MQKQNMKQVATHERYVTVQQIRENNTMQITE